MYECALYLNFFRKGVLHLAGVYLCVHKFDMIPALLLSTYRGIPSHMSRCRYLPAHLKNTVTLC